MSESHLPGCLEGQEAAQNFDREIDFLLSVPKSVIQERGKAYREKSMMDPHRRGPKRKVKPSAYPDPAV